MVSVSVIVPVYNKIRYIEDCIRSILKWGNCYEIILVDDGSTDGSEKLIDEYASRYQQIFSYHQPNLGVSAARNAGISRANGDYIAFVDADDEVVPGSLDRVIEYINNDQSTDVFISSAVNQDEDFNKSIFKDVITSNLTTLYFTLTGGCEESIIPSNATAFITGCKEKYYKKAFLADNNLLFDVELTRNEDVLFVCKSFYYSNRIHYLPITTYVMKDDPNGLTNSMSVCKSLMNMKLYYSKLYSFFESKIDNQYLLNAMFHNSLCAVDTAYEAYKNKTISSAEFNSSMNQWFGMDFTFKMLDGFNAGCLSLPKRISFWMMKHRLYKLVGMVLLVHRKLRQGKYG